MYEYFDAVLRGVCEMEACARVKVNKFNKEQRRRDVVFARFRFIASLGL